MNCIQGGINRIVQYNTWFSLPKTNKFSCYRWGNCEENV